MTPRFVRPRLDRAVLVVVFVGGIAGGLARYGITNAWHSPADGFPWAIFAINTSGAFALCLLVVLLAEALPSRRLLRPALGTGVLGAFTTFSSVVVTTDQLAAHGRAGLAVAYIAGSTAAGLAAAVLGLGAGRVVARRARPRGVL